MSLIDTAKDIYELAKKGVTLELQEQLMKLREEALALQEENLTLKGRVADLESKLAVRDSLTFNGSVYWSADTGGQRDGPYCQRCYDADGKLIRLQTHYYVDINSRRVHSWRCQACSKFFDDKAR